MYDAGYDYPGPLPGRRYAELVGGPLDGLLLGITGWTLDEVDTSVVLSTELGQFGASGRARYGPRPGDPGCLDWTAATPQPTRPLA
ncbi:hypothetical protein C9J60_05025 [Streptomyces sp. A244]|nr:hypothetical protein C9J60_05025 [Streptomyces sp. A244]